jgi:hypothetical protein
MAQETCEDAGNEKAEDFDEDLEDDVILLDDELGFMDELFLVDVGEGDVNATHDRS